MAKTKKKKVVKKAKKVVKKKTAKKKAAKKAKPLRRGSGLAKKVLKPSKAEKPVGAVTHFYTAIKVAIVKFTKPVRVGTRVKFKGATTDFEEVIKSMQYDHKPVAVAPKGKQMGIRVGKRVREGDSVYEVK